MDEMTKDEILAGLEMLAAQGERVPAGLRLRSAKQRLAAHASEFRARQSAGGIDRRRVESPGSP